MLTALFPEASSSAAGTPSYDTAYQRGDTPLQGLFVNNSLASLLPSRCVRGSGDSQHLVFVPRCKRAATEYCRTRVLIFGSPLNMHSVPEWLFDFIFTLYVAASRCRQSRLYRSRRRGRGMLSSQSHLGRLALPS